MKILKIPERLNKTQFMKRKEIKNASKIHKITSYKSFLHNVHIKLSQLKDLKKLLKTLILEFESTLTSSKQNKNLLKTLIALCKSLMTNLRD